MKVCPSCGWSTMYDSEICYRCKTPMINPLEEKVKEMYQAKARIAQSRELELAQMQQIVDEITATDNWPTIISGLQRLQNIFQRNLEAAQSLSSSEPEVAIGAKRFYRDSKSMEALIYVAKGSYENFPDHFQTSISLIEQSKSVIPETAYGLTLLCELHMTTEENRKISLFDSILNVARNFMPKSHRPKGLDIVANHVFNISMNSFVEKNKKYYHDKWNPFIDEMNSR